MTNHGGKRNGAGRPVGSKVSDKTETFYRKVTPKEKTLLAEYLKKLRA
jgi:hypothetical protein